MYVFCCIGQISSVLVFVSQSRLVLCILVPTRLALYLHALCSKNVHNLTHRQQRCLWDIPVDFISDLAFQVCQLGISRKW